MDLLIHDLAAACERDAADHYDVYDRAVRPDLHRREPTYRLRCGRVEHDPAETAIEQPTDAD